jgi:hypothetical protein
MQAPAAEGARDVSDRGVQSGELALHSRYIFGSTLSHKALPISPVTLNATPVQQAVLKVLNIHASARPLTPLV